MRLETILDRLTDAREKRHAIEAISISEELSLADAYRVQEMGLSRALAAGKKLSGYKLGLTSRAKQQDVQVFEPIRGFLLKDMEIPLGAAVETGSRIQPRFEPEIGVILKTPYLGDSVAELIPCLGWVGPAIEILDSRYQKYQFKMSDVVADNTSASGYILGKSNWIHDLDGLRLYGVVTRKNGKLDSTGAPAATFGDPLVAVVELQRTLRRDGKPLEPGQVILTGGITFSVPFSPGDRLSVDFPGEKIEFSAI